MKFENKVVVLTGGVKGIGRCIKETFEKQGAHVCIIDVLDNDYFVGSIGNKEDLICFTNKVIKDYGHVDYIINNAKPIFKGIDSCSYEEFNEALQVGVTGPFMLVKLLKDYLNEDACTRGKVDDIAHLVLFLCSEEAGFITGENVCVDGGMTKLMIYHNDYGWKLGDEDYE